MNKSIVLSVIVIVILVGVGFFIFKSPTPTSVNPIACTQEAKQCPDGSYVGRTGPNCEFAECSISSLGTTYLNTQYGFSFSLPASWKGYTIVIGIREIRDVSSGALIASAPTLSIRHPLWTAQILRQDIPIDIYTLAQWSSIVAGNYSVSAAPIPPSELARNSKYVFALPARYNYVFPKGWEEVNQIIISKPLSAFESTTPSISQSGISGTVTLSPTCPVERIPPDPNCAPKPYSTLINIMKTGSTKIIKTIQSNSKGAFRVDLDLGVYVLQAQGGNVLPRCGEVTVEVKTSKYTTTEISCDTGIR